MEMFDWNYYLQNNEDLLKCGIVTKEQSYFHWLNYGKEEDRPYRFCKNKTEYYISNINYLTNKNLITKSDAWDIINQIIVDGDEKEYDNFDWMYYLKENKKYLDTNIKTKKDCLQHWNIIGKYNKNIKYIEDDFDIERISKDNFDWIYYIKNNVDLIKNDILNLNSVWNHWCEFGKYERRKYQCKYDRDITYETFDWQYYIDNNADLKNSGFTQEGAWQHWIYYGRNEDRKIRLYNENELDKIKDEEKNNEINKKNEVNNEQYFNENIYLSDLEIEKKEIEDYLYEVD